MTMPPPRVLVLMATYNGHTWLEEQIASILGQQGVEVDLVIADDGSTDGTPQLLERLAQQHANLSLRRFASPSGSAAANFTRLLVDADTGEADYVALADQDDVWFPDKLARACGVLSRDPSVHGYSSNVEALFADGRRKPLNKAAPQRLYDHYFESPGPGCTFVLGRTLMASLVPHLRTLQQRGGRLFAFHDWFIYAYARHAGYRWFIDPTSTMLYRQHENNVVGANVGLLSSLRRLRRMRDGWYFDEVRWQLEVLKDLQSAQARAAPTLDPARVDVSDWSRRWHFVRRIAPHSRRRWQDRLWLRACVLSGIVR